MLRSELDKRDVPEAKKTMVKEGINSLADRWAKASTFVVTSRSAHIAGNESLTASHCPKFMASAAMHPDHRSTCSHIAAGEGPGARERRPQDGLEKLPRVGSLPCGKPECQSRRQTMNLCGFCKGDPKANVRCFKCVENDVKACGFPGEVLGFKKGMNELTCPECQKTVDGASHRSDCIYCNEVVHVGDDVQSFVNKFTEDILNCPLKAGYAAKLPYGLDPDEEMKDRAAGAKQNMVHANAHVIRVVVQKRGKQEAIQRVEDCVAATLGAMLRE